MSKKMTRSTVFSICAAMTLSLAALAKDPPNPGYATNALISDVAGLAKRTDPRVVNSWGVAFTPSLFFVAENGVGLITTHNLNGAIIRAPIQVPLPPGSANANAAPTGIALNPGSGFLISSTNGQQRAPSVLLFATEDGTIGGWNSAISATNAIIAVDNSQGGTSAVYKSLAVATTTNGTFLFAANFRSGMLEKYDTNFALVQSFTDSSLTSSNFTPFGIKVIQQKLFVTFALANDVRHDDVAGAGNGFVDIFNPDTGTLVRSFAAQGPLNSPWGLAFAPTHFGRFSGNLLVGNFGDGRINAFNIITGEFLGTLATSAGDDLIISGLWSLDFGREPAAGHFDFEAMSLTFTAGINGEADGLIGNIRAITPSQTPIR